MGIIYSEAGPKDVKDLHFMETQAWLNTETGHLEAITHTWTSNWVFGFTGSVGIIMLGAGGMPIRLPQGQELPSQWPLGVDARGTFWKASSRTDPWSYDVDPSVASQVESMLILHTHHPKQRLDDILREIGEYKKDISGFCSDNPDICSAIGGLA
jgi:hypothetical protein